MNRWALDWEFLPLAVVIHNKQSYLLAKVSKEDIIVYFHCLHL